MKELAKQVYRWYGAGAEFVNLFAQGLATIGYYYSGSSMNLKKGGMAIDIVFPKEGAPIYEGFQMVCNGTKNRDLAEAFINYSMDPVVQARAAQTIFNTPLNRKAAPMIPKELNSVILTDEKRLNKIFFKDWRFFTDKWDQYEERFKKEVLTV
jgi:spermidine/putrescine-binding protein